MESQSNGKAIASLVLGILSCVLLLIKNGAFVGIVLAIVGIVLAVKAKKEIEMSGAGGKGMATAGMVLSIIALALCALAIICIVAAIGLLASSAAAFQ
ncbi:MAG: DUF4190 domain-containing protein [Eubacteriales bacterium]